MGAMQWGTHLFLGAGPGRLCSLWCWVLGHINASLRAGNIDPEAPPKTLGQRKVQ